MGILRNSVRNTTASLLVLLAVSAGEDRPASRPLVNSEMEAWLEALSAREFASRQRATRKLLAAGTAAIPALETAASSLNSESRARAVSILEELALSTETQIWKPAQAALRRLASSSSTAARRAASVLSELGDKQTRRMSRAIRRQGGRVYTLQNQRLRIDLNEDWVGGNRGLRALPRLPGVAFVSVETIEHRRRGIGLVVVDAVNPAAVSGTFADYRDRVGSFK